MDPHLERELVAKILMVDRSEAKKGRMTRILSREESALVQKKSMEVQMELRKVQSMLTAYQRGKRTVPMTLWGRDLSKVQSTAKAFRRESSTAVPVKVEKRLKEPS